MSFERVEHTLQSALRSPPAPRRRRVELATDLGEVRDSRAFEAHDRRQGYRLRRERPRPANALPTIGSFLSVGRSELPNFLKPK